MQASQRYEEGKRDRFGHTAVRVKEQFVIVFGGAMNLPKATSFTITNETFVYNCQTDKWSQLIAKNDETHKPSPRAAHSACAVEENHMVIFGGMNPEQRYADNELYLLKLVKGFPGEWIKVPISGQKPPNRYGHGMVYSKPYIVVFGGNVNEFAGNDAWVIEINKDPMQWMHIDCGVIKPSPRIYSAICVWSAPAMRDMILVYGGRDQKGVALNDLWGLRSHKDGRWDWTRAETGEHLPQPTARYLHSLTCYNNLLFSIGGRGVDSAGDDVPLEMFNISTSEW